MGEAARGPKACPRHTLLGRFLTPHNQSYRVTQVPRWLQGLGMASRGLHT